MATSGSVNFLRNRDEIIKAAFRKIGVVAQGETPPANLVTEAAEALNVIVKAWQNKGIHLWAYKEIVVFLQEGKTDYLLGPTGNQATTADDFIKTELSASAISGATSITVDSITGIANGDNIGVVQSDNTIHWTTVNGAPSGSTVTLTAGLTAAASTDAHVYTYTNILERPLRLSNGRLKINDGNEIPIGMISRQSYMELPLKTSKGKATQWHYNPLLTNGRLYLWLTADSVNDTFLATSLMPLEDFDTITDDAFFPQEWFRALIFNLAVDLAPEYGFMATAEFDKLKILADEYLFDAEAFDQETASIRFEPSSEDVEGYE